MHVIIQKRDIILKLFSYAEYRFAWAVGFPNTFPMRHYYVQINGSAERFRHLACSDIESLTPLNKQYSQFSPVLTRKLGKLELQLAIIIYVKTLVPITLSRCVQFGCAAAYWLVHWLF
jgi:hypothetical protein